MIYCIKGTVFNGPHAAALIAPQDLHPRCGSATSSAITRRRRDQRLRQLGAQLPGGGWPRHALTELLLPQPGIGEIRLLAPGLARSRDGRLVMLFDPPAQLSALALAQLGLDVAQLLVVQTQPGSGGHDRLWAFEQALKSGHAGALLAGCRRGCALSVCAACSWLAQAHDGAAFVMREAAADARAPRRLRLRCAAGPRCAELLRVCCRGPPREAPIVLALPPVLGGGLARRRPERTERAARAVAPGGHLHRSRLTLVEAARAMF